MDNFFNMIELLFSDTLGIIYACNGYLCVINKVIEKDHVKKCFMDCYSEYKKTNPSTFNELFDIMKRVINERYCFLGKEYCDILFNNNTFKVSHIVDCNAFKRSTMKVTVINEGHGWLNMCQENTDAVNEKKIIESLNGRYDIYANDACLGGKKEKPMFWVTCSDQIKGIKKVNLMLSPDRVRDKLGLIHYQENTCLLEIIIMGKKIKDCSYMPTFMDACEKKSRFKVKINGFDDSYSNWGLTADLYEFAEGNVDIDGSPERVVRPIKIDEELCPKFNYIGIVESTRGITNIDNDDAFLQYIVDSFGLDISNIKNYYKEFI